jgi:hypothetical protein
MGECSSVARGDYRMNSMILIGGVRGNINQNDIWSPEDGAIWKKGFRTTFDFSRP